MAIIKDYRGEWDVASVKVNFSNGDQRIYSCCKPLIVPNNYKYDPYPKKGDIITMDGKDYRVLKVDKDIAEVFCMYDANSAISFNSHGSNVYADKELDTYCNSTFYNSLSSAIKSAIIDKTFTQDSWNFSNESVPATEHYTGIKDENIHPHYYLTLVNTQYETSITRHCYALSVQDVLDYLGTTTSMDANNTTLNATNISQMFWNQSIPTGTIWLRSADASSNEDALYVVKSTLSISSHGTGVHTYPRPAFQIDLDKINWSIV